MCDADAALFWNMQVQCGGRGPARIHCFKAPPGDNGDYTLYTLEVHAENARGTTSRTTRVSYVYPNISVRCFIRSYVTFTRVDRGGVWAGVENTSNALCSVNYIVLLCVRRLTRRVRLFGRRTKWVRSPIPPSFKRAHDIIYLFYFIPWILQGPTEKTKKKLYGA